MTVVAETALSFLRALEEIEPDELTPVELARLRALKARIGWMSIVVAEREAQETSSTTEFEEPRSRSAADKAIKGILRFRPWRGKIVSRGDGRWTVQVKTYTEEGTVVLYAATVEAAVRLVDAVEPAVAPLRRDVVV